MKLATRLRAGRRTGFTAVELMIVVVIIGLTAAIAIPAFQKVRQSARATRAVNDMKKVGEAFNMLILINGDLPEGTYTANSSPGAFAADDLPSELESMPLGDGSSLSFTYSSSVGVVELTSNEGIETAIIETIDKLLDDGNTATGDVRSSSSSTVAFEAI